MSKPYSALKRQLASVVDWVDRTLERDLTSYKTARFIDVDRYYGKDVDGAELNAIAGRELWLFDRQRMPGYFSARPQLMILEDADILAYVKPGVRPKANLLIKKQLSFFRFPYKVTFGYLSIKRKLSLLLSSGPQGLGTLAVLGSMNSSNYYHFITDVLGDLWFVRQLSDVPIDGYIIMAEENEWRARLLEMAGLVPGQIRFSDEFIAKDVRLVVPLRNKGTATTTPIWMRSAIVETLDIKVSADRPSRLLFISRDDAPTRRMTNTNDLYLMLKDRGFEYHVLTGKSVDEQRALFEGAQVVVAEHGAGLTNLIWSAPGTFVIDIHRRCPSVPCFKTMAEMSGMKYLAIFDSQSVILEEKNWVMSSQCRKDVMRVVDGILEDILRKSRIPSTKVIKHD